MLDENAALIKTISEYQNVGKHSETVQYQWSLHRNLMYLASIADSNQNLQNLLPVIFVFYFADICRKITLEAPIPVDEKPNYIISPNLTTTMKLRNVP